jgi:DNA-binding LacI/PurR family transcriptional regulator
VTAPALASERRRQILEILAAEGSARLSVLADRLGVTPVTVRRDVSQLANEGVVRRVHGGVSLAASTGPATPAPEARREAPGADATTIGIVVPSMDYYYPGVLSGARAAAEERGLRLVLGVSGYRIDEDRRQVQRLVDLGVDGLLTAPAIDQQDGGELASWLTGLDTPVVLLERSPRRPTQHALLESVVTDHALGAGLAVEHLVGLGHRHIALAARPSPTTPAVREGWHAGVRDLSLPAGPDIDLVSYTEPGSRESIDRALDAILDARSTAVLVHADPESIALLERCDARGISVPDDLSVIAYDDEVAAIAPQPITAVRPPRLAVGRIAVRLVAERLEDPARPAQRVILSPQLSARATTAPPR